MKNIDVKTSAYFTGTFIFLGIVLILIGLILLFVNVIVGIILLILSLVLFTTSYRLQIDLENKTYYDYLWILGFKNGEKGNFKEIMYLYINKNKVSQTMNLKAASSTVIKTEFDGYLKFSEDNKIHIVSDENKEKVLAKLEELSGLLNIKIVDHSEGSSS